MDVGRDSNACTTLCRTGRPDSVAISSKWAVSWRMSLVVSVTCCTPWLRRASTRANTRHVSSCMTSVGIGVPSQSRCTAAGPVGGRRCADHPQPPASIAASSIAASRPCSSSVGSRPALASSMPSTSTSIGPAGTYGRMFSAFGVASRLSRNSGNVTQSHARPWRIDSYGIASTRVIERIAYSRRSGWTGANPNPQLPIATDVTPCQPDSVQ